MRYLRARRLQKLTLVLDRDLRLGPELARGGEGVIHTIYTPKGKLVTHSVAKIFHAPSVEKTAKLNAMLIDVPHDPARKELRHISIAWPTARLVNQRRECIGFLMPYIDQKKTFPLLRLYNPRDRRSTGTNFTWQYLLRIVLNLSSIINALHRKGYIIGDLNESNILVTKQALVTLVDCDSIQVPMRRSGWQHLLRWRRDFFHCVVAKPEYTPPELQGRDFRFVDRTANHDNFALAVLIFLMLMEGWHPFAAIWQGDGMAPALEENIRRGIFPYIGAAKRLRPKYALPLAILPPEIQQLMIKCFAFRHQPALFLRVLWLQRRPGAATWMRALEQAEEHLLCCEQNISHVYSDHLSSCIWCARMDQGIPDPFPPELGSTRELPVSEDV